MIISASRRTDIPAFYSEWFYNRVKEGYTLVKNPLNRKQVFRVKLDYETVDAFVFWTKNPAPMIPDLHRLAGYPYYFLFTVTPYNSDIEKNVPGKRIIIDTFKRLSDLTGPDKVIWRYDPVIITSQYNIDFHRESFDRLARELKGYTYKCIFSFMTYYSKCIRNMSGIAYNIPEEKDKIILSRYMAESALENNIKLQSCCEGRELTGTIVKDGCVSSDLVSELSGRNIITSTDRNQRGGCLCATSLDIGAYNTCIHRCIYCYANHSMDAAGENHRTHNPLSPVIAGTITGDEKIYIKPARKAGSGIEPEKQGLLF